MRYTKDVETTFTVPILEFWNLPTPRNKKSPGILKKTLQIPASSILGISSTYLEAKVTHNSAHIRSITMGAKTGKQKTG